MEDYPELTEASQKDGEAAEGDKVSASASAPELPLLEEDIQVLELVEELSPLSEGVELEGPKGEQYRVNRWLKRIDGKNLYEGEQITTEASQTVWIWEEPGSGRGLRKEAGLLRELPSSYFLGLIASMEHEGQVYMVTEAGPPETLEDLFQRGLPFVRFLSVLAQAATGLSQLHGAGWVHAALRPSQILVGTRVKIIGLDQAIRIGEQPSHPVLYPGYSAPDLMGNEPLGSQVDIYSVGAILYHAATGNPVPETGPELLTWVPRRSLSGVPQILHRCLGPREDRYRDLQALHADLAALLRRSRAVPTIEVAGASIIGLNPTRPFNEDAYGYVTGHSAGEDGLRSWGVFCLADGMGGMEAGEVASQTAVQVALRRATERLRDGLTVAEAELTTWPAGWIQTANETVCEELARQRVRGGTTLLVVLLLNQSITIGHVGDCRLYLLREQEVQLLTQDHSLAMLHVLQGEIAPGELRSHPDRNRLNRTLGERTPLPPYYIDTLAITTGRPILPLEPGDVLILCSDGVWEPVEETELVTAVTDSQSLASAAHQILSLVLERGAPDNATILLIRYATIDVVGSMIVRASE